MRRPESGHNHKRPEADVPMIAAAELNRMIQRGDEVVPLDVRQPGTFKDYPGEIPGTVRIPPLEIPARYGELPSDRLIVPYCT